MKLFIVQQVHLCNNQGQSWLVKVEVRVRLQK